MRGLSCISRKMRPRIHIRSGMRFPLVAPLGNCIPLRLQIPGRIFHQSPQPETASHSKGKFWGAFSGSPPIQKPCPTLNTSSERLPRLRPRVSRKKPREFRGFHICIVLHETPRTTKLLAQHGLLGGCSHVVQIFLGGVILCGDPVIEQHLKADIVGILL